MKKTEWKGIWEEGWATFKDILRCGALPGCMMAAVLMPVAVLIVAALFGLLTLLVGCRSVEYIPVETVRRDTVAVVRERADTLVRLDSIHVKEKGDTVWMEKYRTVWRDRRVADTVYLSWADTVAVPVPVEQPLTHWQQAKMKAGGAAIFAIAGAAAFLVVRWLWRRKKNSVLTRF